MASSNDDGVLACKQGTPLLAALPAARDFLTDAFAHCKFIGFTGDAAPLFEAAGLARPARRRLRRPRPAVRRGLPVPVCSATVLAAPGRPGR